MRFFDLRARFLVFTMLGSSLILLSPAFGQPNKPICGDCDLDFRVTVADTALALQAANGTALAVVDDRCDVDLDGGPSTTDGLLIAQFSAGLLPTLSCTGQNTATGAVTPVSVLEPFVGGFGNCIQGQSRGAGWSFDIFGNPGQRSGSVPAVPTSSTAAALASAWVNDINNDPNLSNYQAIQYAGSCLIVVDTNFNQAFLQITSGGPACMPDTTGTPCAF